VKIRSLLLILCVSAFTIQPAYVYAAYDPREDMALHLIGLPLAAALPNVMASLGLASAEYKEVPENGIYSKVAHALMVGLPLAAALSKIIKEIRQQRQAQEWLKST
jgi:hypothetical protein